ncbi:MAG: 23S rRNA (adenine(1618)-N(6))-methyltransferase RlmF [Cyclobacteriaceae bacterium]
MPNKKPNLQGKPTMNPRNKHLGRYDLKVLVETVPELEAFVHINRYGNESVDFANPAAVKMLNKALLEHYYGIVEWDIPEGYLCPPIPGRVDYIHHMADLLCSANYGSLPKGEKIKCVDIGVGASCIYPLLGHQEYGWSFIGTDIDPVSIASAERILDQNPSLKESIKLRLQLDSKYIFHGVIRSDERSDMTICNPPFHASAEEARAGSLRKLNNLAKKKVTKPTLNFGGQHSELWCEGGESQFVRRMIRESKEFGEMCLWFSTLISKQSNLKNVYEGLKSAKAMEVKTIPMGQGNKSSRIVAWTFLTQQQQDKIRDEKPK